VTLSTSDSSALIRPNQPDGGPVDLLYRKTDLIDFFRSQGRIRPWQGAPTKQWALTYSGNGSAELFVEHQALPGAGKRSFATASISPWYARAVAAVTGHLVDAIAKGGTYEDLLEGELKDATKALLYLMEQTLAGSASNKGIFNYIDAADVNQGLDPATVTLWASLETAIGGVLDVADMQDFYISMTGSGRGADPSVIVANTNQMRNYGNIQGPAAAGSIYRGTLPGESGKPYDLGVMHKGMGFNAVPFAPVRSITNSEILWLDLVNDDPAVYMMRDFKTEELGKRNDNTEFMISVGLALQVPNRRMHGKMTGITP
jgi:hypothetical protein